MFGEVIKKRVKAGVGICAEKKGYVVFSFFCPPNNISVLLYAAKRKMINKKTRIVKNTILVFAVLYGILKGRL